ncbi:Sal-like protein 1 [Gossypium australe]|uniref:Sal-like protein 1 n=1 Tax=Gossypium australe TaxID=47621 RepID=A0A5B6WG06_9ROSI|nr:Sal-like protein 1 [Gossypium australe]
MDPNRAVADDVESNAPASIHGVAQSKSRPITESHGEEAKEAFFQMMNEWFTEYGAEEIRATVDDDPERAEFWLENTIWIFYELSCMPAKYVKCVVSFLRDTAYQWWNTLVSVVPREQVTWEFF